MSNQVILVQEEPISCFDIIETLVTGNGSFTENLEENQQLRSDVDMTIIVKGIRLCIPTKLAFGPRSGAPVAPLTELVKLSLTLYAEGWEKIHLLPVLNMNDVDDQGTIPFRYHPTKFNDISKIDWKKSFFTWSNGSAGSANSPYCILLEVEYVRLVRDSRTGAMVEFTGPNP